MLIKKQALVACKDCIHIKKTWVGVPICEKRTRDTCYEVCPINGVRYKPFFKNEYCYEVNRNGCCTYFTHKGDDDGQHK